jgi:DNA-directed RNA polymerase sigma subunit (sigma70/sigma32)
METLLLDGALSAIFGKRHVDRDSLIELRKEVEILSKKIDLDERELFIIEHRLKTRLTLESIGEKLGGITRERVRQLEFRAGNKIKKVLIKKGQTHILSFKIKMS